MCNYHTLCGTGFLKGGVHLSVLLAKLPILLLFCVLSTFFLLASPNAYAASWSATTPDHPTGQLAAANPNVYVYLDHRAVHWDSNCLTPLERCPVYDYVNTGYHQAFCQKAGETISDLGYSNKWWTDVQAPSGRWGWVSNIYIRGGIKIAGVPDCKF